MKKKIIVLLAWIALTAFYIWNLSDIGRSMGASTSSAIEDYTEMWVEYQGKEKTAENTTEAMYEAWHYSNSDNLEDKFKGDFAVIGATTTVYIMISILCYHLAFTKTSNNSKD